MADSMKELFTVYGGHPSAVGMTVAGETGLAPVREAMERYMAGYLSEDTLVYDLEVAQEDLPAAFLTLRQFEPYGEGVPKPLVRVRDFKGCKVRGSCYLLMGSEKDHFRLNGPGCNAIGFFQAQLFQDYGFPERVDVVGSIESNTFRGVTSPQLLIEDFVPNREG
jgi:single-stranded-DNA-specific exonuclease